MISAITENQNSVDRLLPHGWELKPISEVTEINPKLDKSAIPDKLMVSFVPMQSVGAADGTIDVSKLRPAAEVKKGFTNFQEGDVLFAKITPCMENGKMAVVPKVASGYGFGSTEFHVLRPKNGVDARYLYYFVSSQSVRREAAHNMTGAVGQKRVPTSFIANLEIPLAPPDQQRLIVAEIEKQFSRLDGAVANLKRIKTNLKRYKASVLKAAVEGKLTEEWRKANPDVEPANELLKRILAERRKKPKDKKWKQKYQESTTVETTDLPELPNGWIWVSIEQLALAEPNAIKAGPFGSALKKSFYVPKGYKIYGQEQVINGDPFYGDYYINEAKYNTLKSCAVKPGDILISLVGTIGRVLILPEGIAPGIINPRLVKLSLNPRLVKAEFIKACIESPFVKQLFSLISHGGTMDILNLTILKAIPLPLPSLREQDAILQEIDRVSSIEKELEATISVNMLRADRLRQTVLMKAFSGR
jgi:type I restriction enzyme S subunit